MRYIVMLWHPPEVSPLSNRSVREASKKTWSQLPAVRQKYGIEVIAGYHLDLEHKAIVVVEAPSAEAVRDFLYESGFMHWNDARIFLTRPLEEVREWTMKQPTIF
jgi:hypothetical protein